MIFILNFLNILTFVIWLSQRYTLQVSNNENVFLGLKCKSALFRHEIAYVLGQIQSDACVHQLYESLADTQEAPMVRHECAEALGAIATPETTKLLQNYLNDTERVVRESCIVALDMSEYENSDQFQYADTLSKVQNNVNEDSNIVIKSWLLYLVMNVFKKSFYDL